VHIPSEFKTCIGKTDPPLTLAEHTQNVIAEAASLLEVGYAEKYNRMTGQDLGRLLKDAALMHDAGKTAARWQKCAESGQLQDVGMRHEIASVLLARRQFKRYLWPEQEVAILSHHEKLGHRTAHRFEDDEEFEPVWERMRRLEKQATGFRDALRKRYRFSTIRGLLSAADRRASQRESGDFPADIAPFHYKFPDKYSTKREVQKTAEELPKVAALRAETGSGKTVAALLWAKAHNANRVIFAMPTRFTATSLAEDVDGGLYHSAAREKIDAARLQASDRFLLPVVVTTIDQVLLALSGRTEKQHMRFANLADSVVVMDEIDAYDDFVQGNIQVLSEALSTIDVPHLAMSATLPSSFVGDLLSADVGLSDATQGNDAFIVRSVQEVEKEETPVPDVVEEAKQAIIYANTVDRAIRYYRSLNRDDKILYHSRFTRPHRSEIEDQILSMLSEDGAGGVAVMTQVGEMSLNVTCSAMVTDLCPVDRLAQRAGRMRRYSGQDGALYVMHPVEYPAPYGKYLQGKREWKASEALARSASLIEEGQRLTKADLTEMSEEVYAAGVSLGPQARRNASRLREQEILGNWLIQPSDGSDDTASGEWKSRDIRSRSTVIVGEPKGPMSWAEFRRLQLKRGVSVMNYKLDQAQEKTISIDGDDHQVLWTDRYDRETGLQF
jgi:CRISPR-associated endonuclease/helicase Cas3